MNISPAGTAVAPFLLDGNANVHSDLEGSSKDAIYCDESASLPTQAPESSALPSTPERAFKGLITVYPANEYD
jgi:hypothetical protein